MKKHLDPSNMTDNADSGPHFEPVVQLDEVEIKKGTEDEEEIWMHRAKLMVFVTEDEYGGEVRKNFWKIRGVGNVQFLKHKQTGKTR